MVDKCSIYKNNRLYHGGLAREGGAVPSPVCSHALLGRASMTKSLSHSSGRFTAIAIVGYSRSIV